MSQSPNIEVKLTCAQCKWETVVDLLDISFSIQADPCKEHGVHASILWLIECSSCQAINEVEINH